MEQEKENLKQIINGKIDNKASYAMERCIEEMYKKICENGYEVITDGIEQLPFWDNGVKFFMIKGPNEERIEFCQKL